LLIEKVIPFMIVLFAIFIFGGEVIRGFMFALMVGVVVGTYSSLFVASPIMLDTLKRKKVKVLDKEIEDFLRFTWIYPLRFFPARNQTLVKVRILKGQRHQIRAHLSSLGHPIVGDPLYGPPVAKSDARMYLHHYKISMPGFQAYKLPDWKALTCLDSMVIDNLI
jgi:23S rRNA pseudouridine1911/1915/1917 synthase